LRFCFFVVTLEFNGEHVVVVDGSSLMFQLDHLLNIWLVQWPRFLNKSLAEVDPELNDIIEKEKNRQWKV
jgi:hypothetical protein